MFQKMLNNRLEIKPIIFRKIQLKREFKVIEEK